MTGETKIYPVDPNRWTRGTLVYEVVRLRAINAELLAALEHLVDEQNGPPLEHPRKKAGWEAAMTRARAAIKRAKEAK